VARAFIVREPTGMGKTRIVLEHILRGFAKPSVARWNRRLREVVILGPNEEVRRVWLRELALYARDIGEDFDEETVRYGTTTDIRQLLLDHGVIVPRFFTFRGLMKTSRKRCKSLVIDEWHDLPESIRATCRRFRRDARVSAPWYLGGGSANARVYLVSATPINPTLEREDEELGDANRVPLSDDDVERRFSQAVSRATDVLQIIAGSRDKLASQRFLDTVDALGFETLRSGSKRRWKLPRACGWTGTKGPSEVDLRAILAHIEGLDERSRIRSEYAWAVGLIRTRQKVRGGKHLAVSSKRASRKSFGFRYRVLHTAEVSKPVDAATWLATSHSRLDRLIQVLTEAKVIVERSTGPARFLRKALIFCLHRGVAAGLVRALRFRLRVGGEIDSHVHNSDDLDGLISSFCHSRKLPKILVATDVLSESIDLHEACRIVVHYELPWSPLRLFQRVGRLTRLKRRGAKLEFNRDVRVGHVIVPGSVEEERVNRLARRIRFMREQGLWPTPSSDAELIRGLIGGGPSMHYEVEAKPS
jgi:Helicase conserved C-terminal domain